MVTVDDPSSKSICVALNWVRRHPKQICGGDVNPEPEPGDDDTTDPEEI